MLVGLVALFDVNAGVVLFDRGIDMLDVEGHGFAKPRDLSLQSGHRGMQQIL
jgi:hypothetical protein